MAYVPPTREKCLEILGSVKTVALVGASADEERPSFKVMHFLQTKGYRVVPVNPALAGTTLLGETAYASLADIPFPIDMVDIFRNSAAAGPLTRQAIELGARVVWMQLGVVNATAAEEALAAGVIVVMDRCPAMVLAEAPTFVP